MNIELERYKGSYKDPSLGILKVNGEFRCYTLEGHWAFTKIDGETCIDPGTYAIKYREVLSPMTKRYRKNHPWFTWHLELQDVPDFTHIYIHIGNKMEHTDGCILVGDSINARTNFLGSSGDAFESLYKEISGALDKGEEVTLEVKYR
jgi:hypothetical protein